LSLIAKIKPQVLVHVAASVESMLNFAGVRLVIEASSKSFRSGVCELIQMDRLETEEERL
jgi:hypothetical protein